jgi:uncharacterized membrane protein (UPF0127 family)
MNPRMTRLIRWAALAVFLLLTGVSAGAQQLVTFKTGAVTITTAAGPLKFKVELASDERQREQGLMYRQALAPDAGMLFIYTQPQPVSVWMENTLIPLDILFIRADGVIARIHERAVPFSRATMDSGEPVKYFLELNGGAAARLGIKPGDKVDGDAISP